MNATCRSIRNRLSEYCETTGIGRVFPVGTPVITADEPQRILIPDIAVSGYRVSFIDPKNDGVLTAAPDLVVMVPEPKAKAEDVSMTLVAWLDLGVRTVWQVTAHAVTVFQIDGGGQFLRRGDTLTGDPVLPGFACPVADLFRLPGETS